MLSDKWIYKKNFTNYILFFISKLKFEIVKLGYFNISFFIIKEYLNFENLISLSITNLTIFELNNLKNLIYFKNLKTLEIENLIKIVNNNFINIDISQHKPEIISNINQIYDLILENDYIEIFINIFSKLKNLENLYLGTFTNNELLKIVSIYTKLFKLKIKSDLIRDNGIKEILLHCINLETLDLRDCNLIDGSCFLECPKLFIKEVKFSIGNYNFYNLIEDLSKRGIKSENYVKLKK